MLDKKDVRDAYYKQREEALKSELKDIVDFLEKDGIISYIENEVKNAVAKNCGLCGLDIDIPNYKKMNTTERSEAADVYFRKVYRFLNLMDWYGGKILVDSFIPPAPFSESIYMTIDFRDLFFKIDEEAKCDLIKNL